MTNKIKVWFLSAEVAPFAKTGGLGDVAGALPKALSSLNVDVRICLPLYEIVNQRAYRLKKIKTEALVKWSTGLEKVSIYYANLPDSQVPVYFLDHPFLKTATIYRQPNNQDDKPNRKIDDLRKFSFFTKAALAVAEALNFQPDIIHANDWHTALVKHFTRQWANDFFVASRMVYTIHNLANQGWAGNGIAKWAGLKNWSGNLNFMAEGIKTADIITTVSPTYAQEILTKPLDAGLGDYLRRRRKDLYGIINGIDVAEYNPAKDKYLVKKFTAKTIERKKINKLALQKELGLKQDAGIPLLGLISRLVWQKGLEIFEQQMARRNCQWIFLGTGEERYEEQLRNLAERYPDQISAQIKFNDGLAHRFYAAADIFLVPSRFEPCGLTQMMAMRYGAVPVVRATGGLKDTVNDSNGFIFNKLTKQEFYQTVDKALAEYQQQPLAWRQRQLVGMSEDWSWNGPAQKYLQIYRKLIEVS